MRFPNVILRRMGAALWHQRFIAILLLVVAVAYGVLSVHIYRNFPDIGQNSDHQYTNVAQHIARDDAYSTGERDVAGTLAPTASVPPLYTLSYAASYRLFGIGRAADEAMRVVQVLLVIGTIIVSWRIGALFGSRAGRAAALFAAFDFTAFFFAQNYVVPDTSLGFFMALWLFYLVKFLKTEPTTWNIYLSTMFLGLAMWIKIAPFLLWVPVGALLVVFLATRSGMTTARKVYVLGIFTLVVALFFGGWKLRNYLVTGYGEYSTHTLTPIQWNAAHLVAYQQRISFADARAQLAREYLTDEVLQMREGARSRYVSQRLTSRILRSPVDFGIVTLRALPGMFFGTFPPYMFLSAAEAMAVQDRMAAAHGVRTLLPELWSEGRASHILIYLLAKLHLLLLYGAAVVAVVVGFCHREFRWILVLCTLTTVYVIMVSGAAAQARYRMMVMPIAYVLGGIGAVAIADRFRRSYRENEGSLWQ